MGQLLVYYIPIEKKGRYIIMGDFKIVNVRGHIEVYDSWGQFILSADSEGEAMCELDSIMED